MTTMIERVAFALRESDESAAGYIEQARAAIQAMREPTPQMKVAVRQAGGPQALAYALAAWPTMIDAALKEHA